MEKVAKLKKEGILATTINFINKHILKIGIFLTASLFAYQILKTAFIHF